MTRRRRGYGASVTERSETSPKVVVFAPLPVLTVTIEEQGAGGTDVHLHAGSQGVWQARMLVTLGVPVTLCCVLAGEIGTVLRHLVEDEGITVKAVEGTTRNGAYVHDRRGGERVEVAEAPAQPLTRHELDALYSLTLSEAIDAGAVVLSGPFDDQAERAAVPPDVYRRLAADLREVGRPVVADLAGDRMTAVLSGGVTVVKVSHEELRDDGLADDTDLDSLIAAMYALHEDGAENVIVTRAADPTLVLTDGAISEVAVPRLQAAETRGAGDSLTAGVAAALARGAGIDEAVRLGAAAGTLNVTRHGLGTGDREAVAKLRDLVTVTAIGERQPRSATVAPDDHATDAHRS